MPDTQPHHSDRLAFAIETACAAGVVALRWFQSDTLAADAKSDGSPVTQADRAAEQLVRDRIAAAYPDDGIVGEEFPPVETRSGKTWVIDPIDGTMSFVHGVPLFGTLIACLENGTPTLGVIHMPALAETVAAETNAGCWWHRKDYPPARASVTDRSTLDGAMLVSTSFEYYPEPAFKQAWIRMNALGAHTRGWSDCYAFVLLATGRADAVIEPGRLNLWDIAPVPPIITEAGGAWSDASGRQSLEHGSIIASNGHIHNPVIEAINHQP